MVLHHFSLVENMLALQGMAEPHLAPVQTGGPYPAGLSVYVGWLVSTSHLPPGLNLFPGISSLCNLASS